jgi:hypothetical protein
MQVRADPAMPWICEEPQRLYSSWIACDRIVNDIGRSNGMAGKDFLSPPLDSNRSNTSVFSGMGTAPVEFLFGIDHDEEQRRMALRQTARWPGTVQCFREAGIGQYRRFLMFESTKN